LATANRIGGIGAIGGSVGDARASAAFAPEPTVHGIGAIGGHRWIGRGVRLAHQFALGACRVPKRHGASRRSSALGTHMATTKQTQTQKGKSTTGRATRGTRRSTRADFAEPNEMQVEELILQALETELGGVQVYETAVRCAQNEDLREEWQEYLEQTRHHVEVVQELCQKLGIDAEKETPGRAIVRHLGESLVAAMQKAQSEAPGDAAQLVAAECVVLAETKDHQNWSLIGELAEAAEGDTAEAFTEAYEEVEDEEDEHLYHTMGWARELWIESLGLPAQLPPSEEEKDVKSAIGAARAKAARKPGNKKKR
jgi:rubrerythrin